MSRPAVTILYEDQRGPRQGFGLHALVKACVFDAINGDRPRVEEALRDHRPLKGAGNLLRTCREEIDLIASDGRAVIAVFDADEIRPLLKLPQSASAARVEAAIKKDCRAPDRLSVVLLEQNTESVIEAAADCDPGLDASRLEAALRKDLLERDALLLELSRERAQATRKCILGRMPSLQALVDLVCRTLRPAPSSRPRNKKRPQ